MHWTASWLGEAYCKLYTQFGEKLFTLDNCIATLGRDRKTVRVILSQLKKEGYVKRVGRGLYRAKDPTTITLYVGRKMKELDLKQKEYKALIGEIVAELFKRYRERLVSVVLYGSVARGTAHKLSDVDLIAVIEELPESFPERIEEMVETVDSVRSTKMGLWKEEIYANIQIYPLTPDEAKRFRLLYLDLTTDAIILYDKGAFIEGVLEKMRKRLQDLGARKITLPSGAWYWKLKPEVEVGEEIEI